MTDTADTTHTAEESALKPKRRARLGANYWKLWTASVVSNLGDGVAQIAYPWLASAVTRNGFLIALIAVAQRLPWLLFTLPAGVITDRVDRRRIMVLMDLFRTVLTTAVALAVLVRSATEGFPDPSDIEAGFVTSTDVFLYTILVVAAALFGMAEVLRDNAAQTILPSVVEPEHLEKANGQMWGVEMVANSFIGPPLGSLLIAVLFALPFFFDAATFAIAAALVLLIRGNFRAPRKDATEKVRWRAEITEGFSWLWSHPVLKPMAIILGLMNGLGMVGAATFVLFAQEILGTDALSFAWLGTSGAVGGLLATFTASRIADRLGSGPSLYITMGAGVLIPIFVGLTSSWPITWVLFTVFTFTAVLWNVITVSLRQTIIPDHLLGRVNSVYRFFAWGMMPIGSVIGGLLVAGTELTAGRELSLRIPFFFEGIGMLLLFMYAAPRLTTAKIETARAEGIAAKEAAAAESGAAAAPLDERSDDSAE